MIPLIEAFDISDGEICSAIGNKYGDIYETHLEWSMGTKTGRNYMPKPYKKYMKPIL